MEASAEGKLFTSQKLECRKHCSSWWLNATHIISVPHITAHWIRLALQTASVCTLGSIYQTSCSLCAGIQRYLPQNQRPQNKGQLLNRHPFLTMEYLHFVICWNFISYMNPSAYYFVLLKLILCPYRTTFICILGFHVHPVIVLNGFSLCIYASERLFYLQDCFITISLNSPNKFHLFAQWVYIINSFRWAKRNPDKTALLINDR